MTGNKYPGAQNVTITLYFDSTDQQGWNNSRIVKIKSSCTNETGGNYTIEQNISLSLQTTSEVSECQVEVTLENMCGEQETISDTIIGKLKLHY